MVNHGRGSDGQLYYTLYAHMTKYIVSRGQSVKKGQIIGYVGSTGASTGPHLHYEITKSVHFAQCCIPSKLDSSKTPA